ncbi:MAG: radical SAM protein [Acidobacteria bacterium]|nr:MAG: radical SAM protein [Acidobacteriota bacterium]
MDSIGPNGGNDKRKRRVLICGWAPRDLRGWHWPSLAPPVLVSYLKSREDLAADYEFSFRDFSDDDSSDAIVSSIRESRPWLVGWSTYVWSIERILALSGLLKAEDPDLKIILGGPQVSDREFAEWVIDHHGAVDAVVRGEGEVGLAGLLARLLGPRQKWAGPGVSSRNGTGRAVSEPLAPILRALDLCLLPYLTGVIPLAHPDGLYLNLQSSRGCRYGCGYCAWGRTRLREFPLHLVMAQLDRVLDARICGALFLDADFFADDQKACAILEKLVRRAPGGHWQMEADPTHISDRALDFLAQLSHTMVGLGLQSVTPEVLRLAGRPAVDLDQFAAATARLKRHAPDLDVSIEIMCGLPGETPETYRDSLEFALGLGSGWVSASCLVPLPGTPFHKRAEHYGIQHAGPPTFQLLSTSTFPAEELRAAVLFTAFIRFCFQRAGLRTMVRNMGLRRGGHQPIVSIYEELYRAVEARAGAICSYPASPLVDLEIFNQMSEQYSGQAAVAALQHALLCQVSQDVLSSGWRPGIN